MTEHEIHQLKEKLRCLKLELDEMEQELAKSSDIVELDQSKVGRLSRIDAMQSQQMALEASRRRQQRVLKVDGALQRIESGSFGYCFICDEEIDIRRLNADPTNTRCLGCAD